MGAANSSMGVGASTVLATEDTLRRLGRFAGPTHLPYGDAFWDELLSFPAPLPALRPVDVEEALRPYCEKLVSHHRNTGHLTTLLLHTAEALRAVNHETTELPLKAVNAIAFSTVFIKHYVEHVHVDTLRELCDLPPAEGGSGATSPVVHTLLAAVVDLLASKQATPATYLLHLAAMRLLIVMAATQLTQAMGEAAGDGEGIAGAGLGDGEGKGGGEGVSGPVHPFLDALLAACEAMPLPAVADSVGRGGSTGEAGRAGGNGSEGGGGRAGGGKRVIGGGKREGGDGASNAACRLVKALLGHYIARAPPPPKLPLYSLQPPSKSLLMRLTAATTNVFLLPVTVYNMFVKQTKTAADSPAPLADAAVLLLLILTNYTPPRDVSGGHANGGDDEDNEVVAAKIIDGVYHPFRAALHRCKDAGSFSKPSTEGADPGAVEVAEGGYAGDGGTGAVRVSFSDLFETLGMCLVDDRSTLLLYSLLHGNPSFLEYCLVRQDLDTLMLPLMEMLYHTSSRTPNQIYILLIIVLILSQDASFNANIHKLVVRDVPWYKERMLRDTTLGSLLVVLLIRTVKYNLSKLRDVYLHTNCLAALANMAPHCQDMTAYAAQRLVSLFDMLAKKHSRLSDEVSAAGIDVYAPGAEAGGEETVDAGAPAEMHIFADFLRIVLEVINSMLTYALPKNPEVVYALLHRQELFEPFAQHPRFADLVLNVTNVLTYFNRAMDEAGVDAAQWTTERVTEVITAAAAKFRAESHVRVFQELRFTYEEEINPEEFFVPYVWSLVCAHSGVPWNPASIALLPAEEAGRQGGERTAVMEATSTSPAASPRQSFNAAAARERVGGV